MDDNEIRTHQMTVRVREFNAQHQADFSAAGASRQFFSDLINGITKVESLAAAEATGVGQARHGTRTRGETRAALRQILEAIRRIARVLGVERQFAPPAGKGDDELMNAAESYKTNATPLKEQFIAHELPVDFLEQLDANIDDLRAAIVSQGNAVGDHVSARASLDDALDECVEIVRNLDAIMKNKYADNPGVLAEWISASHIERAPRRTPTPGPAPDPTPVPVTP